MVKVPEVRHTIEPADADTDGAPVKDQNVPAHVEIDTALAMFVVSEVGKAVSECRRDLEARVSMEIATLRELCNSFLAQDSDQALGKSKIEDVSQEGPITTPAEFKDVLGEITNLVRADPLSEPEPASTTVPDDAASTAGTPAGLATAEHLDSFSETVMGHIIELHLRADDVSRKCENIVRALTDVAVHMNNMGLEVRSLGRRSVASSTYSEGPSDTDTSDRVRSNDGTRSRGRRLRSLPSGMSSPVCPDDSGTKKDSVPAAKSAASAASTLGGPVVEKDKPIGSRMSIPYPGTPRPERAAFSSQPMLPATAAIAGHCVEDAPVVTLGDVLDPNTKFHTSALPVRNRLSSKMLPALERRPGSVIARV